MSPFDAGSATPDAALIRPHFEMLHSLAAKARAELGIDGILVLACFGENPKTGRKIVSRCPHFAIGDVEDMVALAAQLAAELDRNVYAPWVILRKDIPTSSRGKASDVLATLAFAVDADSDPGKAGIPPLPMLAPYVIASSSGNLQPVYPLRRALTPQEAVPIHQALWDAVGGDKATADLDHVWRVPGCLNWANKGKADRGRPFAPQLVTVVKAWDGSLIDAEALREAAAAMAAERGTSGKRRTGRKAGNAEFGNEIDTGDGSRLAEVEEALTYIDPDLPRADWIRILMAIHDEFSDDIAAFEIAVAWSRRSKTKFVEGDVERARASFKPGGGIAIATLFAKAEEGGCDLAALRAKHREQQPDFDAKPKAKPEWPEPDPRYLRDALPPAPPLPVEIFGPWWATWIKGAAEAKAAPSDYVASALLATASSLIGNSRWAAPWLGWAEPPVLWTMNIGRPSSNKSPGYDAVMTVLRRVERQLRDEAKVFRQEWRDKAEVAKLVEAAWKEEVRTALREGGEAPSKPAAANPGAEPVIPRLVATDVTIEKLALILEKQPRGVLLFRDELSGWLMNMTRYAAGSSDRPFWAEAYGGRAHSSDRVTREGADVEYLLIGVSGGIQPDKLRTLLLKSSDDEDGLPSRIMPFFPDPVPVKRPTPFTNEIFLEAAIKKLLGLQMVTSDAASARPYCVQFTEDARNLLDAFRVRVRTETDAVEGLLASFTGKLPGMVVRLALNLAYLDWTAGSRPAPPEVVEADHFERAARFMWEYALPMARRAYFHGSLPVDEVAARKLARLILERGWRAFRARDVLSLDRAGLATGEELAPALLILEDAAIIAPAPGVPRPKGGRPARAFNVNPHLWGDA